MRTILAALAVVLVAGPASAAGKSFKDWTAVCDNLRACAAFGFSPEAEGDLAFVRIARTGEAAAAPHVLITHIPDANTSSGPWRIAVDGKPVAGLTAARAKIEDGFESLELTPPQGDALIGAIRNGSSLSIVSGGKPMAVISLAGSAAALLWLDDQQKRVGTVTALGKPGSAPASAIPPIPAAPRIAVGPPASQKGLPTRMPASVKARLKDVPDCSDPLPDADEDGIIARLAPGVVLYGPVCERAAYNEINAFFIGDEKGGALKPVLLPLPPGSTQATAQDVMNVDYDPKTRTLSSFAKGRGLGDCGDSTDWVWDGTAFRLLRQTYMPECRGVTLEDWPSNYAARLK